MKKLIVILALLSGCCAARARWTKTDTIAAVTLGVLLVADYTQTAGEDGIFDRCLEANPILGDDCGKGGVPLELYLSSVFVAHTAIAATLPKDWRRGWQGLGIGLEAHSVWLNWQGEGHVPFE